MGKKGAEILAPAGSFESMKAAVAAGADAVYIGGSRFGARAYAENLDEGRMLEAIDYAHLHGVLLYMTVNTLIKEEELADLFSYLAPYYERGLDGVIVQDLGALSLIRRQFPDLPVHASTQMTVTGVYGARVLAGLGVSRVVAARELSLDELKRIHSEVPIEVEAFVHGALCYCYSGQCLMSSFIGGRSGNRGRCAQPCRLPYEAVQTAGSGPVGREKASYLLSMKDLCTLDRIPELLEAGIASFKIEGRMKSPRYTAGVVKTYRKYVDLCLEKGREAYRVDPADRRMLLELFDRGGLTEGYYGQHNGPDMIARKEKPAFRKGNQELFDELDQRYVHAEKQEPIRGKLSVREGEAMLLELSARGRGQEQERAVSLSGEVVQKARSHPASGEELAAQMKKTGHTPFFFEELQVELEGEVFVPVQTLKELRRQGLRQLEEELLRPYRRKKQTFDESMFPATGEGEVTGGSPVNRDIVQQLAAGKVPATEESPVNRDIVQRLAAGKMPVTGEGPALRVLLAGMQGFSEALSVPEVREILVEADGIAPGEWGRFAASCHQAGKDCVLAMPVIFRHQAGQYFDRELSRLREAGFDGLLVRNLEEMEYARNRSLRIPLYADHSLYVFNRLSREALLRLGCERVTLPLELNSGELARLGGEESELVGYGFLPAMVSAQCIVNTVSGCSHKPGWLTLRDRTGRELPVRNHCGFCYNVIYNPSPLSLIDQGEKLRRIGAQGIRLQFTREPAKEVGRITRAWADMLFGRGQAELPGTNVTRGHFKRGVE